MACSNCSSEVVLSTYLKGSGGGGDWLPSLRFVAETAIVSSASSMWIIARLIFSRTMSACSISASNSPSSSSCESISSSSFRSRLAFSVRDNLSCLSFDAFDAVMAGSTCPMILVADARWPALDDRFFFISGSGSTVVSVFPSAIDKIQLILSQ